MLLVGRREFRGGRGVVGRHRGAFGVRGQVSIRLQVRLGTGHIIVRLGTGHIIGVWGQVTSGCAI